MAKQLSNQERAVLFNITPHDDGKTPWRVGAKVWYRPKRSRKWRQGTVTYSMSRPSRGPSSYRIEFVRIDWNLAAEVSADAPENMCPHGYVPLWTLGNPPHPCPRCRRELLMREIEEDIDAAEGEARKQ